jgi:hypothetical protein
MSRIYHNIKSKTTLDIHRQFLKKQQEFYLKILRMGNLNKENKIKNLLIQQINFNNNNKSDWIVNLTDIDIPQDIQYISLGPKIKVNNGVNKEELFEFIADVENKITEIPDLEANNTTRHRITNIIQNHINRNDKSLGMIYNQKQINL